MNLDINILRLLSEQYGNAFYLLDIKKLASSYNELQDAFSCRYHQTCLAYSYKTNYIPIVCKEINHLGGYAEVVSEMEYALAKRIGVIPERVIFNGPLKSYAAVEELLLSGGQVNIDSKHEMQMIEQICASHPDSMLRVGIRCNYDVSDGVVSRFGIDTNLPEFEKALHYIRHQKCMKLSGLHCHFAARSREVWQNKVFGMLRLLQRFDIKDLESVDFGGGLYGKMANSLKMQFQTDIPDFYDYAEIIAVPFAEFFRNQTHSPKLIIEPGSALVGDAMQFVSRVVSIKNVRNHSIATLEGSMYNINPTLSRKNLPVTVYHSEMVSSQFYSDIDFGGYTCIESDYLYRGYTGALAEGDFVVFDNAGSYSVVLKPPFIHPNYPILCVDEEPRNVRLIKRAETLDDIFSTYEFDCNP